MKFSENRFLIDLLLNYQKIQKQKSHSNSSIAGFTLLEILITVLIIGILFGISATSWVGLLNNQRINQANQNVFLLLQETKTKAQKQNQSYTLFFRDNSGTAQYAISPTKIDPNGDPIPPTNNLEWKDLAENKNDSVQLSFYSPKSTDLNELKTQTFDYRGVVPEDRDLDVGKRIIVSPKDGSSPQKCVIVATLLGTLRTESDSGCTTDENGNDISGSIQDLN